MLTRKENYRFNVREDRLSSARQGKGLLYPLSTCGRETISDSCLHLSGSVLSGMGRVTNCKPPIKKKQGNPSGLQTRVEERQRKDRHLQVLSRPTTTVNLNNWSMSLKGSYKVRETFGMIRKTRDRQENKKRKSKFLDIHKKTVFLSFYPHPSTLV